MLPCFYYTSKLQKEENTKWWTLPFLKIITIFLFYVFFVSFKYFTIACRFFRNVYYIMEIFSSFVQKFWLMWRWLLFTAKFKNILKASHIGVVVFFSSLIIHCGQFSSYVLQQNWSEHFKYSLQTSTVSMRPFYLRTMSYFVYKKVNNSLV